MLEHAGAVQMIRAGHMMDDGMFYKLPHEIDTIGGELSQLRSVLKLQFFGANTKVKNG